MQVIYAFLIDNPAAATERQFVREAEAWPFPNLPAPGDALPVGMPGGWKAEVEVQERGVVTTHSVTPPALLQPRVVERVVYDPAEERASIVMRADGLGNDVEAQVAVLRGTGFTEVT